MSCPLFFFCLQLGNSALPPVAILVLAANLTGQAAADRPIPLIKGVLLRQQQQHKTHDASSSDLAGSLFCCWQPFLNFAFCLAGYIIAAMLSTHGTELALKAASLATHYGIAVVAKS